MQEAMSQFRIDIADLERDVSPARPHRRGVRRCIIIRFQQDHAVADTEMIRAVLLQPQRIRHESGMGLQVAYADDDADPIDTTIAARRQRDAVAVRVAERLHGRDSRMRRHEPVIAGKRVRAFGDPEAHDGESGCKLALRARPPTQPRRADLLLVRNADCPVQSAPGERLPASTAG